MKQSMITDTECADGMETCYFDTLFKTAFHAQLLESFILIQINNHLWQKYSDTNFLQSSTLWNNFIPYVWYAHHLSKVNHLKGSELEEHTQKLMNSQLKFFK